MGKVLTEFTNTELTKHSQNYLYSREQGQNVKSLQTDIMIRKNNSIGTNALWERRRRHMNYIMGNNLFAGILPKTNNRDDLIIKTENGSALIWLQKDIMSYIM